MTKEKGLKPSGCEAGTADVSHQRFTSPQYIDQPSLIRPTLLLHSCCGPCSSSVIFDLAAEFSVTVFFYNPNITDADEYAKRKATQLLLIEKVNDHPGLLEQVRFLEGRYEPERFYDEVKGLELEPEGGLRCRSCFRMRLEKTAETARLRGFDCFATTLSVSPHKNEEAINEIGRDICARYGVGFLDRNFKKNGGFERSIALSKQYGLYRQRYCGCEFSKDIT